MESFKGRFEPTRFEDLTVTIDFHCHSACRFCIVQEGMNYFRGVPLPKFTEVVADNSRERKYRRVTFTGGEVTLEKSLFDYLAVARNSGTFDHIRLQTNGRLCADPAFARRLVDAGVDEFFVSLHGHDAASQDYISQRPGSFDEAIAGIANLKELGVCVMTNTVITTLNVDHLADIVETLHRFAPVRMEFWNYLPMEDYADERSLLAPMSQLVPSLRAAIVKCRGYGAEAVVKYVPRCLLGTEGDAQDNTQPDVVIVEKFYDIYPKFACVYEAKCEHAETCLGLHHPYISKFGWEEDVLVPTARTREWREPDDGPWVASDAPGRGPRGATEHPQWVALIDGVAEAHGGKLLGTTLQRRSCTFHFKRGDTTVDVVLTGRDDEAPALVRTRSFNVHYRNLAGADREAMAGLVRAAVGAIVERDPGGHALDLRKGLVGPEALRPRRVRDSR